MIDELRIAGGGHTRHVKRLIALAGDQRNGVRLRPGEAWIEGDNADASSDSRTWGPVPWERLSAVGVAVLRGHLLIDVRPRMRAAPRQLRTRAREALLDLRHRVHTRGFQRADTFGFSPDYVHPYVPTPWEVAQTLLDRGGVRSDDVFVDYGCGQGRVLVLALERGVRRAVGIEIVPSLAAAARRNVARYAGRCQIIEDDAAMVAFPDDATIAYAFNAFPTAVFASVVAQMWESLARRQRPLRLVTYGVSEDDVVRLVRRTPVHLGPRLLMLVLHHSP